MMHPEDFQNSIHPPQFVDRRKRVEDSILLHIQELKASQHELSEKLTTNIAALIKDSFPEGDPAGHRRYHEASIAKAEAEAKFWAEMRVAAAKWAGLGVLGFLATAVWIAIKTEVHR